MRTAEKGVLGKIKIFSITPLQCNRRYGILFGVGGNGATNQKKRTKKMGKTDKKETANARRERLAKELETAYNNGGDYEKVIKEIRANKDSFDGRIAIKAKGLEPQTIAVSDTLPPPLPASSGWKTTLYLVKVSYAHI